MQPATLPDPNFAAALALMGQNNLFRDMSGMAQTAALAGHAMGMASAGAGRAASQAGDNMQAITDAAAQIAAAYLTGGASIPPGALGRRAANDSGDTPSAELPKLPNTATSVGGALQLAKQQDEQETAHQQERARDSGAPPPAPVTRRQDKVLSVVPESGSHQGSRTSTTSGTSRVLERVVRVFTQLPGTNAPVHGFYEVVVQSPGHEWDSASFQIHAGNPIGQFNVRQPPGAWAVLGRIAASLPDNLVQIPITVIPGLDPIDFTAFQSLQGGYEPFQVTGTVDVASGSRTVDIHLEGAIEEYKASRTIELSASAGVQTSFNAEVSAGIEAKASALVKEATIKGEVVLGAELALSGQLAASQAVTIEMTYQVLKGFRFVKK